MDLVCRLLLEKKKDSAILCLLRIPLFPGLGVLLARDTNLCLVRRAHADVAAAVADRDARIRRNGFWRNLQVEVKSVSPIRNVTGDMPTAVVRGNYNAKKAKESQNKKNLARGNPRRACIAGASCSHAFI